MTVPMTGGFCGFCGQTNEHAPGCVADQEISPEQIDQDPVPDKIETAFNEFHKKHPEVYRHLVSLAIDALAAGQSKMGIGQLFEVLRWRMTVEGLKDLDGKVKLNNNYRALYARKIMAQEPYLAGIFNTRARGNEKETEADDSDH